MLRPAVVHRPRSGAKVEHRAQCAAHIRLGVRNRVAQRFAEREMRGNRRRQRAAGAVGVRVADAFAGEPLRGAVGQCEHIVGLFRIIQFWFAKKYLECQKY